MRVVFLPEAYRKFRAYVHMIDYEISGLGKIRKEGEDLIVEDVKIFQQTVTGGHTEFWAAGEAGAGYRKFWDDLIVAGEDMSAWKLWWHSHVNMQASFSGTDYDTIDGWDFERPEDNWLLSIVTNKKGDVYVQADIFQPLRCTIRDITWDVAYGELENQGLEGIQKEIDELVKVDKPTYKSSCGPDCKYHGKNAKKGGTEIVYRGEGLCSVPRFPSLTPERRRELALKFPNLFPTLNQAILNFEGGQHPGPNSKFWDTASEEEWDEYWEQYAQQQMEAGGLPPLNYEDEMDVTEGEIVE